jgi:hypothetical protein
MGHDISGFKNEDKECEGNEIAHLRRGAFNPLARAIYGALGVIEFDAGCSGCGETANFTDTQLRQALAKIPDDEDHDPERTFLNDCIEKGGGGVWIVFW